MKTKLVALCCGLLCFGKFNASQCHAAVAETLPKAQSNTPGVEFVLSASKSVYNLDEPVIIDLKVINHGNQEISYDEYGPSLGEFNVLVKYIIGLPVPLTTYGMGLFHEDITHYYERAINILPGKYVTYHFLLGRVFDMSLVGAYTVNISKDLSITNKSIHVVSNTFMVKVTEPETGPFARNAFPEGNAPNYRIGQYSIRF